VGRGACFEEYLLDETVGPPLEVPIDGTVGNEFSFTERGGWCIAEPLNKRYKRTPNINNPPHAPHIRR
jgi:hypothetical protein